MKKLTKYLIAMALAMAGVQAHAVLITPEDCVSDSCTTGTVTRTDTLIRMIQGSYQATEQYRSDLSGDSGTFAASYTTTFDGSNATIQYATGAEAIVCESCFLLVKDGDVDPPWYLFDITWNGLEDISLQGFWPDHVEGISHISIFEGGVLAKNGAGLARLTAANNAVVQTRTAAIPEPGPLALLGIGLLGMIAVRLKKAG